jgi:beta-glucanase (GH16 family)
MNDIALPRRVSRHIRAVAASAVAASLAATVAAILATAAASAVTSSVANAAPTCGPTIYKSPGHAWQCSFDDEFSGRALDVTKWTPMLTAQGGYHNGPECYVNSANNMAESNGTLRLTARKEAAPFYCKQGKTKGWTTQYTSASVSTGSHFSQAYGRFDVRAKLPGATITGLQTSFWLWPVNAVKHGPTWPQSGEIDIAEIYTKYPNLAIPYIHYVPKTADPNVTTTSFVINPNVFHDYVALWTPTTITIQIDGKTALIDNWNPAGMTKPAPFDQPFMVQLTQALGIRTNAFDPAHTPLPATTQIDYVRVWK